MNTIRFNEKNIIPSKVICVGRNYVDHIAELGNEIPDDMVVFFKPNSSISSQLHSFHEESLHYEAELCFLYKKHKKPHDFAEQGYFEAVAIGLDLTKRKLQARLKSKGLPWERSKAFDGSAVFSEFVEMPSEIDNLSLALSIDGNLIQSGGVALMMYKPNQIIAQLSRFITLEDGDVVMTGTPKGVGEIVKGSSFEGKVNCGDSVLVSHTWTAI